MAETSVKERTAELILPLSSDADGNIFEADGDLVAEVFWVGHCATRAAFIVKAVNSFPALVEALKNLAGDILDYERVNNIAPSPGRDYCWSTTKNAVDLLISLGITELPISGEPEARSALSEADKEIE